MTSSAMVSVAHSGHVTGVEPFCCGHGQARRQTHVMHDVAEAQHVGKWNRRPTGGEASRHAQVRHLAGAHQHDVSRLDAHPAQLAGGVEVRWGDGVAAVEDGGVLGPGHVEEHPPADERVHEMDPEPARSRRVDRRCRVAVVERAPVAHVCQSVPMRGALQRHDDDILVGADPFGVVGQRHVHIRHGAHRVEARPARHPSGSPRPPTGPGPGGTPVPVRTQPAARRRTSSVTKLSVPSWSSWPQRPQFLTLAAIAVNCSEAPIAAAG